MKNLINKRIIVLVASAALLAVLAHVYFVQIPKSIDVTEYNNLIRAEFSNKTNHNLDIKLTKGYTTWDLCYKVFAKDLVVKDSNDIDILSGSKASLKVFLPALLFKRISLKEINIDDFQASVIRGKNGKFNLVDLIPKTKDKGGFKVKICGCSINLLKYFILYKDQFLTSNPDYKLRGDYLNLSDFNPEKYIKLKIKGEALANSNLSKYDLKISSKLPLKRDDNIQKLSIAGEVSDFVPQNYIDYIKICYNPDILNVNGKVSLDFDAYIKTDMGVKSKFDLNGTFENFNVIKKSKGKVVDWPANVKLATKGNYNNGVLTFDNFECFGDTFNALVSGSIAGFKDKLKRLNLKIKVDKSRLEDLARIVPKEVKVKKDAVNKALKNNLKSNVCADFSIKGITKDPRLKGFIQLDEISLLDDKPEDLKAKGKIDFYGNTLNIDVFLPITDKQYVKVQGPIAPWILKKIDLQIETSDIDLEKTQKKLLAIRDIIGFKLGPVPEMHIKGQGRLNLKIANTTKNPMMAGLLTFENAYIKYNDLSKPAKNVNGLLLFHENKFIFKDIEGLIEGQNVVVSGYTTIKSNTDVLLKIKNADLRVAQDLIRTSVLLKQVSAATEIIKSLNGRFDSNLRLIGPKDKIQSKGYIKTKFANVSLVDYSKPITGVNGEITIDMGKVIFNGLKGRIADSNIEMQGIIDNQVADVKLTSEKLDLHSALNIIQTSKALVQAKDAMSDISDIQGSANTVITLKGNTSTKELFDNAVIKTQDAKLSHRLLSAPVNHIQGSFIATLDDFQIQNVKGMVYGSTANAHGKIYGFKENNKSKVQSDVFINVEDFDLVNLEQFKKSLFLTSQQDTINLLNSYGSLKGKLKAQIRCLPNNETLTTLEFNNLTGLYSPTKMPVKLSKGKIITNTRDLYFNDLQAILSTTPIVLNGSIKSLNTNSLFDLQLKSVVNSKDLDQYVNAYIENPIKIKSTVPLNIALKGSINDWDVSADTSLTPSSNIEYKGAVLGDNYESIRLKAKGNVDKIVVENFEILSRENDLPVTMLKVHGTISAIHEVIPVLEDLKIIATRPVSIKLLNPVFKTPQLLLSSGTMKGYAVVTGKTTTPTVAGKIILKDIKIPKKSTVVESATLDFTPAGIYINKTNINLAGSKISLEAVIDNVLEPPFLAKYVKITSPSLNIDQIIQKLNSRKNSNAISDLPFLVIKEGTVNAEEMVVNNLITDHFATKFTLTPDWLLTVPTFSMFTTGGLISGDLLFNISSRDFNLNMRARHINANAIATIFCNMPNEVYGTLDGEVNIETKGSGSKDFISKSNGKASFNVQNGRLARLGSMEYLLKAINVVQGGVTGFNVNNVLDLLIPHKTGNFESFSGTLVLKNGVVTTEDTVSHGDNLSLYISGDFDMQTNYSDIVIMGKLSKKVSGMLGPVGSLSIGSVIQSIPGVGYSNASSKGVVDKIPGIKNAPFIEMNDDKYRRFITRIEGDLYNPKSLKSFKWID